MESSSLPRFQSPLNQNPVPSPKLPPSPRVPSSPPSPPTQTLILSHPSARLSSSPASSPRVVESAPMRQRSIRPEMSDLMDQGVPPGADFFNDSSGDEDSEWEDADETRNFSEVEGLRIRNSAILEVNEEDVRGRRRESSVMRALPPFNQIPAHDSGTAIANDDPSSPLERKGAEHARQMSLRRLGKVRLVHNRSSGSASRGTPRESLVSNDSEATSSVGGISSQFPELRNGESGESGALENPNQPGRHRRNTSESIRADSILNAHVITMRALESLSPTASLSRAHGRSFSHSTLQAPAQQNLLKAASFTEQQHIKISPLTNDHDPNRPPHLPAHFIKTPYPFTAHKEFPKPRNRPQPEQQFHEHDFDRKKGKHVLGIVASDGEYDLRSRLQRNEDAQGVIRSRSDLVGRKGRWGNDGVTRSKGTLESQGGARESVVWVSLKRRPREGGVKGLERVVVPSSLMTTSPEGKKGRGSKSPGTERRPGEEEITVDFDDQFFAERLREVYRKLAGPWILRILSARSLKYIQLGQVSVWSGDSSPASGSSSGSLIGRLLAARGGLDTDSDARSPFTEHNLMHLYRSPKTGKARYTWVHWARRVAASNGSLSPSYSTTRGNTATAPTARSRRRAKSQDMHSQARLPPSPEDTDAEDQDQEHTQIQTQRNDAPTPSPLHQHSTPHPDSVTAIQFVHAFSARKILVVLGIMMALSVLAALLWVFLGESAWVLSDRRGKAERVGSGMLVGILVLALEGVGFGAWVVGSWAWL